MDKLDKFNIKNKLKSLAKPGSGDHYDASQAELNEVVDKVNEIIDTVDGINDNGIILAADGAVDAPSITFASQTDMGLYQSDPTTLGVAVEGQFVGRFTVDKGLELNDASIVSLNVAVGINNHDIDPASKTDFANQLVAGDVFTGTPGGNIDYTLPTGTQMDTANGGAFGTGYGPQVSVINLSANTITLVAASGFTIVGGAVVAANTSGRFQIKKTAANTYVIYRLS